MFRRNRLGLVRVITAAAAGLLVVAARPAAQQAPLPTAREVVDRGIEAAGGVAAFKKIQSMRGRGTWTATAQQMTGDVELYAARPNKAVLRVTIAGLGKIEEGFDGKVAWSIDPVTGPSVLKGQELVQRAEDAWFDAALHEPSQVKSITIVGRDTFDGRAAYRLKVLMASGNERTEYYDVETRLQIGHEAVHDTPMGKIPGTAMFRNYQSYGAVKLPSKIVERALGFEHEITFTSYEFDTVPASAFELPAVIKAMIK